MWLSKSIVWKNHCRIILFRNFIRYTYNTKATITYDEQTHSISNMFAKHIYSNIFRWICCNWKTKSWIWFGIDFVWVVGFLLGFLYLYKSTKGTKEKKEMFFECESFYSNANFHRICSYSNKYTWLM